MLLTCVNNREEGLLGLWKGVTPNVGRNAIINAAELASYDTVNTPARDHFVNLLCSLSLSHVACCLATRKKYWTTEIAADADKVSTDIHWLL